MSALLDDSTLWLVLVYTGEQILRLVDLFMFLIRSESFSSAEFSSSVNLGLVFR